MKKILTALLLGIFIWGHPGDNEAQTRIFGGLNYDEEVAVAVGFGTPLFQSALGDVWEFSYVNFGLETYKSLTSEFGLIRTSIDKSYYGGLLLGGNGEWLGGENPTTYLVGATGLIGGYQRFYGYVKYKFALENGTLYPDGLTGGVGVHLQL